LTREQGRERVERLVERFGQNADYYRSVDFDEESTKQNFITPFFEALGWDVTDRQGRGPAREVILETRLHDEPQLAGEDEWDQDLTPEELAERQAHLRFPDYGFRLELMYRFFAEAKKPRVRVVARGPAFQIKSYAWSQQLPISVVTNFDTFVTFDCTQRPSYDDPMNGHVPELSFALNDYIERWDALWDTFSKDAVANGSLDRALRARVGRRGALAVDRAFLDDLADWRQQLASDLEARNPGLDRYALAEATQRILDRIVFLRVCEDRFIEPAPLLRRFARMQDSYHRLAQEFRRLDAVYNGQLFGQHFSEGLEVSDDLFQRLIAALYPPFSPYRFDVIGADLLGAVYERFLGQTIEITDAGQVILEDKPEVRHAGGVYYTPRWVVDRIVQAALAPHVEGKGPRAVRNIRILDPACGSGSFLLGAMDYLFHYLDRYYTDHPDVEPSKHTEAPDGTRRMTRAAKAEVLSSCIHGIDIDPQAVEVTQMSLYLKILEGETAELRLFHAGALLPPMRANIRSGNTLLGTGDVPGPNLLDEDLARRINPLDWESERDGFGTILAGGGFHAIIGNPPYTRVQVMRRYRAEEAYLYANKYVAASVGSWDIAGLFVERCLPFLRQGTDAGRLAFIISRQFAETNFGRPLRQLLSGRRAVESIIDFRSGFVFEDVSAYTLILVTSAAPKASFQLTRVIPPPSPAALAFAQDEGNGQTAEIDAATLTDDDWDLPLPGEAAFLDRLQGAHHALGQVTGRNIFQGVVTGADVDVFRLLDDGADPREPNHRLVHSPGGDGEVLSLETELLRPVYRGRSDILRFLTRPSNEFVLLPYTRDADDEPYVLIPPNQMARDFPATFAWLRRHEAALRGRASGQWNDLNWYGYSRRQNLEAFENPKLLVPYMVEDLCAQWDEEGHFFVNVSTGGYGLVPAKDWDSVYVEALLNSRLLSWVLRRRSRAFANDWFAARKGNLERLPIARGDAQSQEQINRSSGDAATFERPLRQRRLTLKRRCGDGCSG
jgi:N-6 DNA Methylase